MGEGAGAEQPSSFFLLLCKGDGQRGSLFDSLNPGHPVVKTSWREDSAKSVQWENIPNERAFTLDDCDG